MELTVNNCSTPQITVLMPVYNGERYLREAIESILGQTYIDFEFLIIDDGSIDNSLNIIDSYNDQRINVVRNERNIGVAASLNRGLDLAKGEYVARMDADDISYPTRLEKQVRFLDSHSEIPMVGTQTQTIDQEGKINSSYQKKFSTSNIGIRWSLMFDNSFSHSSVMFRRKVIWDEFSGYDVEKIACEDFDLWARVVEKYVTQNLSEILIIHRNHPKSVMAMEKDLNLPLIEGVILRNLRNFSGFKDVSTKWAATLLKLQTGPKRGCIDEPEQLISLICNMFNKFCELHPEATREQDIRSHIADQFSAIAYYSATHNRLASIRAFAIAFWFNMRAIRRLCVGQIPMFKFFVLWIFGNSIFKVYRRNNQYQNK